MNQAHSVKVGDILSDVWGYSMTIVDFYRVTKVTPKTVTVEPLASKSTSEGYLHGTVVPSDKVSTCRTGLTGTLRLSKCGGPNSFTGTLRSRTDLLEGKKWPYERKVSCVRLWDGQPEHFNHAD